MPDMITARAAILDSSNSSLLFVRKGNARHDLGLWQLAGGKKEIHESAARAGRREVEEETRLRVASINPDAETREVWRRPYGGDQYDEYVAWAGLYRSIGGKICLDRSEVSDGRWVHLQSLHAMKDISPDTAAILEGLMPDIEQVSGLDLTAQELSLREQRTSIYPLGRLVVHQLAA